MRLVFIFLMFANSISSYSQDSIVETTNNFVCERTVSAQWHPLGGQKELIKALQSSISLTNLLLDSNLTHAIHERLSFEFCIDTNGQAIHVVQINNDSDLQNGKFFIDQIKKAINTLTWEYPEHVEKTISCFRIPLFIHWK
ncbi:MAG: hypothetical protein JKY54_01615 [Flavobacteriales bacterium]|nr:hypothetical protein [Flavobacteriales bacterium]